ncbi:MAG: UDP-4-amino-4,6-dideoxy-N-acetyl-beta-L-altrosamine transaminase [Magnetospirillum sp.]|nr:UDP-4-amino-4,6-dideoxy-N-acetyl-beta-L-altrosamine transaminase [Magnetospirillum sp.]
MTVPFLPYARQSIDDTDIAAVTAALRSDYLTTGPMVEVFERAFSLATGAGHSVACNSGTAALHLAVLALDLAPGDAVIVPTITFLATANVVRMAGAEVVFADVDSDSGLMTPATLAAAIESASRRNLNLRAAIPVHLNGQLCQMPALHELATLHGIDLIEDACHALGVPDVGATVYSRLACFSMHPVKAITTVEGGAVTTRDAAIAARIGRLRSHGMVRTPADFEDRALSFDGDRPNPWSYEMQEIGWNYRLPDVQCALGVSQLAKLDLLIERRSMIAKRYDAAFAGSDLALQPAARRPESHGWHLYVVLIDFAGLGRTRGSVMESLRAQGIGSQVHYLPVHRQPYYRRRYGVQPLPGADAYYARCLSIPLFPAMTDGDVDRVIAALSVECGIG